MAHHRVYRSLVLRAMVLADIEDAADQPLARLGASGGGRDNPGDAMGHSRLVVRILNNGERARQGRSLGGMGRLELCRNHHSAAGLSVLGGFMARMGDIVIDWSLDIRVLVARHYI
jgi:hypothetical protein